MNMTVFKMWMMAKLVMKKRTMQLITGEDEYDCCNNVKDAKNGNDAYMYITLVLIIGKTILMAMMNITL